MDAHRTDTADFDVAGVFDEDYLHFYAGVLTDERSDADTDLIVRTLGIVPGSRVLDLACGHGRVANRLAARGCTVTGIDATPLFLQRAREDAAAHGVEVEYVAGDMRALPWTDTFDAVVCWFTSYGYFDDADNKTVLGHVRRALRPGGRFLLEMPNLVSLLRTYQQAGVHEVGDDLLVDRRHLDPLTGRDVVERLVVRDGHVRRTHYTVRLLAFPELRDWLADAGFGEVSAYGEDGEPLRADHRRMLVVARKPASVRDQAAQ